MKKKYTWLRWAVLAACVCLLAVVWMTRKPPVPDVPAQDATGANCYFYINGDTQTHYEEATAMELVRYSLMPKGGLGKVSRYEVQEADIGEPMGIVTSHTRIFYEQEEMDLKECPVYHFAKYPQENSICIIQTPWGYRLFTSEWKTASASFRGNSSLMIRAGRFPRSVEEMELWSFDAEITAPLKTSVAKKLFAILEDKPNIGREAFEKRFVQLWKDTYGTDEVYYDEYNRCYMVKELDEPVPDPYGGEPDYTNYAVVEKSYKLFREDSCLIWITTDTEYTCSLEYVPSIGGVSWWDEYYVLTASEVAQINELLQIEEFFAGQKNAPGSFEPGVICGSGKISLRYGENCGKIIRESHSANWNGELGET